MNALQVYKHEDFGEIVPIVLNGKPYFPASRVARMLGYNNPQKAIRDHCISDGVTIRSGVSHTTNQHGKTTEQLVEMKYISEGNLYRLIARSKLPAAETFERWIFDEIVPSVMQTGSYTTSPSQLTPTTSSAP